MPTPATRDMQLVYGSLTIGGSSAYFQPTGPYRLDKSNPRGVLEVEVQCTDPGDFDADDFATLEEALRDPRQRATLTYLGGTVVDWDHAGGTGGVNTAGSVSRGTLGPDAGWGARYIVRIEADLIPDGTDQDGLRDAKSVVTADESNIRRANLSGVYIGSDYSTRIATYASAVQTRHSVTAWDLIEESKDEDVDAKVTRWSRTYLEIPYNQSSAGLDHASIINPSLTVSKSYQWPGDTETETPVRRLIDVAAIYSSRIDKSQVSDLEGFYKNTIRPWIVSRVVEALGGVGRLALVGERAQWDPYLCRIDATLSFLGMNGSTILAQTYERQTVFRSGVRLVPVWDASAHAARRFQGPAVYEVTETYTRLRVRSGPLPLSPFGSSSSGTGGGNLSLSAVGTPFVQGAPTASQLAGYAGGQNTVGSLFSLGGGGSGSGVKSVGAGATTQGIVPHIIGGPEGGGNGGGAAASSAGVSPTKPGGGRPSKQALISRRTTERPKTLGVGAYRLKLIEETEEIVSQWYDDPSGDDGDEGRPITQPSLGGGSIR